VPIPERLQPLIDRARDQLASMTERDRKLLLGLLVFFGLLLVGGGIFSMKSSLDTRQARVTDRQDTLRRVQLMAADYGESHDKAEQIAAKVAEHGDTDLSAYLEQVAQRTNVGDRLDSVRQKSQTSDGGLVETVYAVKLSNLTQEELPSFLFEMESTGYPIKVRNMTVKSRKRSDQVTLNVDLDVSAFKLASANPEE